MLELLSNELAIYCNNSCYSTPDDLERYKSRLLDSVSAAAVKVSARSSR